MIQHHLFSEVEAVELRKPRIKKLISLPGSGAKDIAHKQTQHVGPPTSAKPSLPVKPLHIRPGLKPVKIPTVDDKFLVKILVHSSLQQ